MVRRFAAFVIVAFALLWVVNSAKAQAQALSPEPYMFRNMLVCGDASYCPNQRGVTNVGGNIANTGTMTSDFWECIGAAASSINWSVVTPGSTLPGSSKAFQMQRTAANANTSAINCGQVLDTDRSTALQGKTMVLSWKTIVSALGGVNGFSALNGILTFQVFSGTGTAQGYTSMIAGTWTGGAAALATQAFTESTLWNAGFLTFNVPNNATELGINVTWLPLGTAGTSDLVQLAQVQLEPITITQASQIVLPTAFEFHGLEIETALAWRRAYVLTESNTVTGPPCPVTGANVSACIIALPMQMRAAPTATLTVGGFQVIIDGAAGAAATGGAGSTGSVNTCVVTFTNAVTAAVHNVQLRGTGTTGSIVCSADLTWNEPANDTDQRDAA